MFDFAWQARRIGAALSIDKYGVGLRVTAVGRLLAEREITPREPLRRADPRTGGHRAAKSYGRSEPARSGEAPWRRYFLA